MLSAASYGKLKMLRLTLPFPPSINHYWKHKVVGRRAQVYLSKQGIDFKVMVNSAVLQSTPMQQFTGRVGVSIVLNPPTLRKFDIDNRIKAALDALTGAGVWIDDEQVDELTVVRGDKVPGGSMTIRIEEINK